MNGLKKPLIAAAVAAILAGPVFAEKRSSSESAPVFPGPTWETIANPAAIGYSPEKLAAAGRFAAERLKTDALMIVVNGRILYQWGAVDKKFFVHSVRKSVLSALIGPQVKAGRIALDRTMKDLGIDDEPPLSEREKSATVGDCLKARSGVYHAALAEGDDMAGIKPERDSRKPGEYWVYNNWDFNVLGTIFEKASGRGVYEAIKDDLAVPLHMEDFAVEDGYRMTGDKSIHAAYHFRMTARDLARFGLLMLRKGVWDGKRILPEGWIEESTRAYSDAALYGLDGYGYMWWVAREGGKNPHLPFVRIPAGSYSARGAYGQYLLIVPAYDMVIVHRVDSSPKSRRVSAAGFGYLVRLILAAGGKAPDAGPPPDPKILDACAGDYELRPGIVLSVFREGDRLFIQRTGLEKEEALPESETVFFSVANSLRLEFLRDGDGVVTEIKINQLNREIQAKRMAD